MRSLVQCYPLTTGPYVLGVLCSFGPIVYRDPHISSHPSSLCRRVILDDDERDILTFIGLYHKSFGPIVLYMGGEPYTGLG
jgi:hypothetical protein